MAGAKHRAAARFITGNDVKRKRLRRLMKAKNLTSVRIAHVTRVHPVTVRRWRQSGSLPIETLEFLENYWR